MNTKYICIAALGAAALLGACDDNFETPPVIMPPVTEVDGTISLNDFKTLYWGTLASGPAEVGFAESGDSLIFEGRVCSSDATGNIYKNIVVQSRDENGEQVAIAFSVNRYDIYELFPFGQEVVVYATGLQIGPYRNLLQFGSVSGDQMTFMDEAVFTAHVFRNKRALPQPALVDTTLADIPTVAAAKANQESLRKWQSRLVRFDNVSWAEAGQSYAPTQSVTRNIVDAEGNRLPVRCSSFADFSDEIMPYGTGSVVGILSYYASDWQLTLIDAAGSIGFDGEAPEPVVPDEPKGDGTAASPYNVVKALEVARALTSDQQVEAYAEGIITKVEIATDYGNATYQLADKEGGETLQVYRGYFFNGDKFTSTDQLKVGDKVVVSGKLVNYMGNTPQFTTGSRIVSLNGQGNSGGGDTPAPVEGTIYSALAASAAEIDWTFENIELGSASYVWQWKEYNGSHYLNGSAFVSGAAVAAEAYAVSPEIDLTGATGCALTFEHAAKFQTTLRTLCSVCVREVGQTAWTELTCTWPEAGSWTFQSAGNISLAAFDGKKIQVAFRYKSSAEGADTWEIKNLAITGNK